MRRVEKSKEKEAGVKPKESKTEAKASELGDKSASGINKEAEKDQDKEKQVSKKQEKENCGEKNKEKAESCAREED